MSLGKKIFRFLFSMILLVLLFLSGALIHNHITSPRLHQELENSQFDSYQLGYRVASQQITQQKDSEFHFWVGEVGPSGPLISGPHQYPFVCTTLRFGLGQPIIETETTKGTAVFREILGYPLLFLPPIGHSANCSIYTRVDYYYFSEQTNTFKILANQSERPDDIAMLDLNQQRLPFIVRVERGTINRFIYSIAMLAPYAERINKPKQLDNRAWNGKLVYKFQGGIGIGHNQGLFSLNKKNALFYDALSRGYAVAYSTGTRTTTQYNLKLAEETAMMLKLHFEATYGSPKYTIGIGASGGAVQQHIIAQNNPGIIDAAITQAAYPDMITQSINIPDCELLERYFDEEYSQNKNSHWRSWRHRSYIEGTNVNDVAIISRWDRSPAPKPGSSECVAGWRGTMPLVFNPNWTHPAYFKALRLFQFPDSVIKNIKWTHWNDLVNIYPRDTDGHAPNGWDNVGVQYGLVALNNNKLSVEEFLNLNACVGGWKQPKNMMASSYPWDEDGDQNQFDPWDKANMRLNPDCKQGKPAPRTTGNLLAMQAAYTSGHVFTGKIDIPVLDIRWYLEPILDMHHAIASFSVRARLQKANGHADNHIIWVAECSSLDLVKLTKDCQYNPTASALDVMGQWMENIIRSHPADITKNKPAKAIDSCFNGDGTIVYAGNDAWDGIIEKNKPGSCTSRFPVYSTSRIVAGDSILGTTFKCALKSVSSAIRDGTYKNIEFTQTQIDRLKEIFPSGVCDYSQSDRGMPKS